MSYWHDFTHPVITEAGDNDEATEVAEDFLGIPGDAQDAADRLDRTHRKRQRGDFGKRGPAQVTPTGKRNRPPDIRKSNPRGKKMPMLHRRRYGGIRKRRGGYVHGASQRAGAYNPVHYRRTGRRRRRYRKLRWGTKVRKQALGLFEGKRLVVNKQTIAAREQNNPWIEYMFKNFVTDSDATEVTEIKSVEFAGRAINLRGIKINLWLFNKTITHPVVVRIICGWQKVYADVGSAAQGVNQKSIFRNTDTKERARQLNECAPWQRGVTWRQCTVPIDKQAFHVEKDMTVHLGPSDKDDEQNHGNALKQMAFWWEFNNRKLTARVDIASTDDTNTRLKKLSFNPVMFVYHCNPEVGTDTTSLVDYKYDYCVYWKDPLG